MGHAGPREPTLQGGIIMNEMFLMHDLFEAQKIINVGTYSVKTFFFYDCYIDTLVRE